LAKPLLLRWSRFSVADRLAIFDYLEERNPLAAAEVDLAIERQVQRLTNYPMLGKAGRVEGTRELMIKGTPYLVAYQLERTTVRILRILHTSQLWPPSSD
jgi:toxin ParE1/3/4